MRKETFRYVNILAIKQIRRRPVRVYLWTLPALPLVWLLLLKAPCFDCCCFAVNSNNSAGKGKRLNNVSYCLTCSSVANLTTVFPQWTAVCLSFHSSEELPGASLRASWPEDDSVWVSFGMSVSSAVKGGVGGWRVLEWQALSFRVSNRSPY